MKEIKGFIKSKKVAEVLWTGYKSGQNVVLYGKGGYGKSAMAEAFLRQIGARKNQITIKALSVGTTLDDLIGGVNIRVLRDTGEIFYNVEKSIFSTPFLILEEAFDAPTRVLEGLKDILTSGEVRNGQQRYKIKTKFIIVATNRSKSELASDESSKALMERFPLSLRVEWNTHNIEDYKSMVKVVTGKDMSVDLEAILSYILESIEDDDTKNPPSPRTVMRAVKIVEAVGVKGLMYMDGLPNIERALADYEYRARMIERKNELMEKINDFHKRVEKIDIDELPYREVRELKEIREILEREADELELDIDIREI